VPEPPNSLKVLLYHAFSAPDRLALWVKCCIGELVQSVSDDVKKGRFFAYLTRWRQPEEMYHRALYMLFVADQAAIPHIVSGERPNSFSTMWREVNRAVYDGRGRLDQKQLGLRGEAFTAMETLNNSAHASFATIVTCIDFAKKPEFHKRIIGPTHTVLETSLQESRLLGAKIQRREDQGRNPGRLQEVAEAAAPQSTVIGGP
jgi:hypothetical protein